MEQNKLSFEEVEKMIEDIASELRQCFEDRKKFIFPPKIMRWNREDTLNSFVFKFKSELKNKLNQAIKDEKENRFNPFRGEENVTPL